MRSEIYKQWVVLVFQHNLTEQLQAHNEYCGSALVEIFPGTHELNDMKNVVMIAYIEAQRGT